MKFKTSLLVFLVALFLFSPTRDLSADEWEFVIAPYLLGPFITGDTSIGRIEGADIDVDPGDVFGSLELGGMIYTEAMHESGFGISLHYAFMDLGDDASGPREFINIDADIFQGIFEGYLHYKVEHDSGPIDFYSGVRWWDIDIDVDVTGNRPGGLSRRFSGGANWVDPVIGARYRPMINDEWSGIFKGDIGGFGIESDFTWNVQAGVLYQISELITLAAQYRVLSVDYSEGSRGSRDRFSYDTITHGPMLGVAFTF